MEQRTAQHTAPSDFGAGRLFLADSRLALGVLSYARYRALARLLGVSREQADLLSFVLGMGAARGTLRASRRAALAPLHIKGKDVAMGAFAMREAAMGLAGPPARKVPRAGLLLTLALAGGYAIPRVRYVARTMREAERRVRLQREMQYSAARNALASRLAARSRQS